MLDPGAPLSPEQHELVMLHEAELYAALARGDFDDILTAWKETAVESNNLSEVEVCLRVVEKIENDRHEAAHTFARILVEGGEHVAPGGASKWFRHRYTRMIYQGVAADVFESLEIESELREAPNKSWLAMFVDYFKKRDV